jgi:formylglycine-generating enzyme required for sulfatase activity
MKVDIRAVVLALFVSGCGGGNTAAQINVVPDLQMKGQAKCSVTGSQDRPLIVEWPSADRGQLETHARNRGVVVVHYSGCEMRILDGCTAPVTYGYSPITRKRDHVTMRDTDDLYANVPAGAAKLEAKLARAGQLDVDMMLVGRWDAERSAVRRDELQGACDGATHVVSALTVGAFTFTAGADAVVAGGVTTLGARGGADSTSKRETLNADGDENACGRSSDYDRRPPMGCGALLRVEVVPIGSVAPTPEHVAPNPPPAELSSAPIVEPTAPVVPPTAEPDPLPSVTASLAGGTFTMGDRHNTVTVRPFSLDVTEVTAAQYAVCVRAGRCNASGVHDWSIDGSPSVPSAACNYGVPGRGHHPMNCLDATQAADYCRAQQKRLPTEEEWEWAARGGPAGRLYPWGNANPLNQLCWSGVTTRGGTCPVASLPAGDAPGAIHDLAGNVAEWTSSLFAPPSLTRVTRGGGWNYRDVGGLRAANRHSHAPVDRVDHLGFRCAR